MKKREKKEKEFESEFSSKNHNIASILCILGAPIGLHKIYLGHYLSAFIMFMLCISAAFFQIIGFAGVFICYCVLYIWVSIEIRRAYYGLFTDKYGKMLSEDTNEEDCLKIFKAISIAMIVFGALAIFNRIYLINLLFTSIFFIVFGIKSIIYLKKRIDYIDIQIQEQKQKRDNHKSK